MSVKKFFNIAAIRDKVKKQENSSDQTEGNDFVWTAVSHEKGMDNIIPAPEEQIDFIGKNLENGRFSGENLHGASFSVANLTNVDFSGADLRNVDFSGANLTDANLSGADLSGAILSGAVLARTNFTGAKMHGVKFTDAYLEDAILIDAQLDEMTIEELQELIEYMAKYYPHKLNLTKLNLTLLDLKRIDLSKVNLRGVDFTGVDFTGVNIMELDLSECIITPQQIAQALGRVPGKDELANILAPKRKPKKGFNGIDLTDIFLDDGRDWGVWDLINDKGISVESLLNAGKKVFRHEAEKPRVKDSEVLQQIKSEREHQAQSHNNDLRKTIEERKRKELEARKAMKKELQDEMMRKPVHEKEEIVSKKEIRDQIMISRDQGRGRD